MFLQNHIKQVCLLAFLFFNGCLWAAQAMPETSNLPRVVKYSGVLKDSEGHARTGSVGVIFAIYDKEDGIAPLWLESQSVTADETGHYSVLLGSTKAEGLPSSIFASGEARWIGVQVDGQAEQPLTLLVSVPYALKAADADTLGGMPLSAFLLASNTGSKTQKAADASKAQPEATATVNNSGTLNFVAKFDASSKVVISAIFENAGNVGIGTASKQTINGNLNATGVDDGSGASGVVSGFSGVFTGLNGGVLGIDTATSPGRSRLSSDLY
jgi:hypothetical protein